MLRGVAGDGRTTVGSSAGVVTVKYYFVDGSAVQGDDYHGGNSSVVFTGGASRAVISVLVLADRQPEAAETFQVGGERGDRDLPGRGVSNVLLPHFLHRVLYRWLYSLWKSVM